MSPTSQTLIPSDSDSQNSNKMPEEQPKNSMRYRFPVPKNVGKGAKDLPFNIYNSVLQVFFHLSSIRFTRNLSMQKFSKLAAMFSYVKKASPFSKKLYNIQRTDCDMTFKREMMDGCTMDFGSFVSGFCILAEKFFYGIGGKKKFAKNLKKKDTSTDWNFSELDSEERHRALIDIYLNEIRFISRIEMMELILFKFDDWKYKYGDI